MIKRFVLYCLLAPFAVGSGMVKAQQPSPSPVAANKNAAAPATKAKPRRGVIKGRVVEDGGQPVPFVDVRLFRAGVGAQGNLQARTDENGRFELSDLSAALYSVSTAAPGYYLSNSRTVFIGDDITLTLVKGSVITGIVRMSTGEPLPGVPVGVVMVRDADGKAVRQGFLGSNRRTDDRGIYRIFGLRPGVYYVVAGTRAMPNFSGDERQTFYPSSSRDTAAEVLVAQGQETSGIDITMRDGRAHSVSGVVTGVPEEAEQAFISLNLVHATSGAIENAPGINVSTQGTKFEIRDIEDGDYLLSARFAQPTPNAQGAVSDPIRVKVRGADVAGLKLVLRPLAALAGQVVLEAAPAPNPKVKCEKKREASLEEISVRIMRDTKEDPPEFQWLAAQYSAPLDDKGAFLMNVLSAGQYRLQANLPTDNWYVKTISQGAARARQPLSRTDLVANGVQLKTGARLENIILTIAEGAAAVSGKVVAATDQDKLPSRLRLYLVPTEKEMADDVLRYAQTDMQKDGIFAFANLAPGKYWLLTKEIPAEEENGRPPRLLYWEAPGRLTLRKEGEAEGAVLTLQTCQAVKEFSVRHKTRNAVVKPAVSIGETNR